MKLSPNSALIGLLQDMSSSQTVDTALVGVILRVTGVLIGAIHIHDSRVDISKVKCEEGQKNGRSAWTVNYCLILAINETLLAHKLSKIYLEGICDRMLCWY